MPPEIRKRVWKGGGLEEVSHCYDLTELRRGSHYRIERDSGPLDFRRDWLILNIPLDLRRRDHVVLPEGTFFIAGIQDEPGYGRRIRAHIWRLTAPELGDYREYTLKVYPPPFEDGY